jgi:DNA-binding XRE family transcriptional regulator
MAQSELIVLKLIVLRLRESAGMTQAEMAKLLQVPLSTLTRWEAETLDREALDTETLDTEAKKVLGLHAAGNKHKKG